MKSSESSVTIESYQLHPGGKRKGDPLLRRIAYRIPPDYEGRKTVHFLRGEAGCSAALVKKLKQWDDGILLNGAHARTIDRLRAGDLLEITMRDADASPALPAGEAPILYEDDDVIVFNKPAGMPCHQSRNHQGDTLQNAFAALCAARGETLTFRCVNRLDRNTTGAAAVAKNARAAALLAGKVEKVYLAAVPGTLDPPGGTVDAPIGRPDPRSIRRAVMADGQRAVTVYRTVSASPSHSLVRCELPTGRTHQIRVHMAYLGHPLLGDDLYGGDCREMARQALHCARLHFPDPSGGAPVTVEAPLPKDMQKFPGKGGAVW